MDDLDIRGSAADRAKAERTATPDDQARTLRRQVIFWRRVAGSLLGVVCVVGIVLWQRDASQRAACREALGALSRQAREIRLETTPVELLEAQWQHLRTGDRKIAPGHYELLVRNWLRPPKAGEAIPLAVCGIPHSTLWGRGRHVLLRESDGDRVQWRSERQLATILEQRLRAEGLP